MTPMVTAAVMAGLIVAATAVLNGAGRLVAALALVAVGMLATACQPPPPPILDHKVLFTVSSDVGEPVAGARLFRPGVEIGRSGADGKLAARFRAADGALLTVHVQCPDGYVDPIEDTQIVLRELATVKTLGEGGLRVLLHCRRTRVIAAVVVRTGYPDLPILYEGQELTRTSLSGVAHVSAMVPPHETFALTVDTSKADRLRPRNPAATFTMSAEDGFFVFDSGLEELPLPPRPKKKHKRPKPKPGPPRPVLVPPNAHLGSSKR
ncbi:MAG TPA: hypothetical protein VK698_14240 [Kofleriaceae bacterium]|nr:hypothetical protein [Kofleriaceae bacterium]